MKQTLSRGLLVTVLIFAALPVLAGPQNDIVGYWSHELRPGFNLIAFPVLPETPTPQAVIGDKLGAVEISTWDNSLNDWRYAKFDPATNAWSGNLFLLNRGVGYWVNLLNAAEPTRLVVVGHPELYTKFNWRRLPLGRNFYAPTYGKPQALNDIPPDEGRDMVIDWDATLHQFRVAEAAGQGWRSALFTTLEPDHAYIAVLHHSVPRPLGPPLEIESQYERLNPKPNFASRDGVDDDFVTPPRPVIVGNIEGLAVCNPNGEACGGELGISVYRERVERDRQGNDVPVSELISAQRIAANPAAAGRFRLALAVGDGEGLVQAGDLVYLVARAGNGAETRSTSFEVPEEDREVTDVSFNDPLSIGGVATDVPVEFNLGAPYPNPFNDRFFVTLRLPETAAVTIALYDIQGRLASTQERALSAGSHRLTIQGGNLAAGIYWMKVNAGGKQGLVKIAHLK